jgi:hypothetical protein
LIALSSLDTLEMCSTGTDSDSTFENSILLEVGMSRRHRHFIDFKDVATIDIE